MDNCWIETSVGVLDFGYKYPKKWSNTPCIYQNEQVVLIHNFSCEYVKDRFLFNHRMNMPEMSFSISVGSNIVLSYNDLMLVD